MLGADGGAVQAVGVLVELIPQLTQEGLQHLHFAVGKIPDGPHADAVQRLPRGPAHEQEIPHRQRPDDLAPVLRGDDGGGVRLFVVAAQLGEDLVEGHAHRHGEAELLLHAAADLIGNGPGIAAEKVHAAGDVQPALVHAEGLHQIGVVAVELVDLAGILPVQSVVGGEEHQPGGFLLGLPDGLRRLDAQLLGVFVFGQNDAVAGGGIAADGHRQVLKLRVAQQLHRGEKAVQIAVQYHPLVHSGTSSRSFVLL